MRVFHGIVEIAGQMGILSGALKRKGHIATGYNTFHTYLGYREHIINTSFIEIANTSKHIIHFYDIFHFHYGSTLQEDHSDLERILDKGKKMVMHHWGNDVRFHEQARSHNPYVYTGDSPPNEVIHNKLVQLSRRISHAIVQDFEVYPYVAPYYKKVHILPIAIDLAPIVPYFPSPSKKKPLILHAPTNPLFKGTAQIEKELARLRNKYEFDYVRVEGMNHEQAVQIYRNADIIVDQILCGSYGLLSVEAMALGKPVVTFIRNDLLSTFPSDLPIVNANPDTVYEKVKMLLESPEMRRELGQKGRAYVEREHASDRVAERLMDIYASL